MDDDACRNDGKLAFRGDGVVNPPPVCVTSWGSSIAAGTSIILYDSYLVNAPDTCSAYGSVVSCDLSGVLAPAGATGYTVCNVAYDTSDD